jgi:molybdopterin synthase sulfur carrier subunit
MTITILAFGIARDIIGSTAFTASFHDHATVATLRLQLLHQYPGLTRLTSFAIAVNGEYATAETIVKPGDELAIIPPVSGG